MANDEHKFRLVIRSDVDGLFCAVLLRELDVINEIKFVHPNHVQDVLVLLSKDDIAATLPFDGRFQRSFDQSNEQIRLKEAPSNYVSERRAPSAARIIYDYFGGQDAFQAIDPSLMNAVDKAGSSHFNIYDVLNPTGWAPLNFVTDARTGLGHCREFRISNYDLMANLKEYCRDHTIDEILLLQDVKERVDLYNLHEGEFVSQIRRSATTHHNLVVLDLQGEATVLPGNRFMIYVLFPEANISIQKLWGGDRLNTVFATGESIFDNTSNTNIGKLALRYGGGGHESAGTRQVDNDEAGHVQDELIAQIVSDGYLNGSDRKVSCVER